jgi:hypothetical protein
MEPNNLCQTLIVYGSYAPGGSNHHLFSDIPGEWIQGKIVATSMGPDEIGPGENELITAWKITFSDCTAEMFTPDWDEQKKLLYDRWLLLDQRMGAGWARGSRRWWPAENEPVVGQNGMIVVNIYLPSRHFPYLTPVGAPLKPFGEEILDIWVGYFPPGRQPEYFKEIYDEEDDDAPISEFAADQGEVWLDHDFMELGSKDSPDGIKDLVAGYSWSDQYADELTNRVNEQGIERFNSFVLLTAGEVSTPCSVHKNGVELHYMGQFAIRT